MNLLAPVLPNYESFLFYGRVGRNGRPIRGLQLLGCWHHPVAMRSAPGLWKNARSLFSQRLWPLILAFCLSPCRCLE